MNNYEDPRVFYLSRTKGWVLPNDLAGASRLQDVAARGAQFYAHVTQKPIDAELAGWLAAHATRVHTLARRRDLFVAHEVVAAVRVDVAAARERESRSAARGSASRRRRGSRAAAASATNAARL